MPPTPRAPFDPRTADPSIPLSRRANALTQAALAEADGDYRRATFLRQFASDCLVMADLAAYNRAGAGAQLTLWPDGTDL